MGLTIRWCTLLLVSTGLLWSEAALAVEHRMPPSDRVLVDGRQVARRARRKKKRRKALRKKTAPAPAQNDQAPLSFGPGGRTHVIFEVGASIKGQTTKAGEVRVLERRNTELQSMVKRRTNFQKEIIDTVFPDRHTTRN
jgi:hypothetical protein